jgi:hypothetical protein
MLPKHVHFGNHTNVPPQQQNFGADEKMGKIHDPTFLLNYPKKLVISREDRIHLCAEPGKGTEGEEGNIDLERIRNNLPIALKTRLTVFCAIYTYSGHANMTQAISETWGRRCDGILYASDVTSNMTGHFQIPTNSRYGFGYKGMIQRTRSILAYLYDNFLDDYDFFHICGDDVFIIVENLKVFLSSKEVKKWESVQGQYVFAGFWLHWRKLGLHEGYFFLGGGSGYTISKKGLKAFVEGPLQTCNPYEDDSYEDIWFSDCARTISNNFIYTGDEQGGQRYHQGPISNTLNFHLFTRSIEHAARLTGITSALDNENEIVSNSSIAFHQHHQPHELRRYELLLYRDLEDECR